MKQFVLSFILWIGVFTPINASAQNKNRIAIHSGVFHSFFDNSPILNTQYPWKNNDLDIFNGLFLNSSGVTYSRLLNAKSNLSFGFTSFRQNYNKYFKKYPIIKPVIGWRYFTTLNFEYTRNSQLSDKFNFIYGGGINYRHGEEGIIITAHAIFTLNGYVIYEQMIENVRRNDFGINTFLGVELTPRKWLTIFTKIDFLGSIYMHDKKTIDRLHHVYKSPQFPSRYDLSWKFGVGINFGK